MFEKKSQGAVEFILIFFFVLTIVAILMYIIGLYSLDVQKKQNQKVVDDFANSISREVLILEKVEDGYYRKVEIPNYLMKRYDVKINSSFIIIQDLEIQEENVSPFFYQIPGGFNVIQEFNTTSNSSYLIFEKISTQNYNGLDLS